jgi:hypothetical protein
VLQACFSREGRLSGWFLEEAVETGMSTTATRRIVGAFTPHFLLSAGILGKEWMRGVEDEKRNTLTQAPKEGAVVSKGERDGGVLTRNSVQGLDDRLEVPLVGRTHLHLLAVMRCGDSWELCL